MTTAIALLRAVNVGGTKVPMAELRAFCEAQGLRNVRTVLQTGNVVFETDGPVDRDLAARLETGARDALGLSTDFILRTAGEWEAALAANPFRSEAAKDPSHLVLVALSAAPPAEAVDTLRSAIRGRERVEAVGDMLFAVYPDGIGTSKLTLAIIERKLGRRGTGRNWNTAAKLAAIASSGS